jgi:hypothetical protein
VIRGSAREVVGNDLAEFADAIITVERVIPWEPGAWPTQHQEPTRPWDNAGSKDHADAERGEPRVISLGSRAHIFAPPHLRAELIWCFGTVLGCGEPASIPLPGVAEPVLGFRFPNGGSLSIEFTDDAPDSQPPHGGAWLELQTDDSAALRDKVLAAGLPQITHAGHDFYFAAPGGQVFSVEATSPRTTSGAGT